MSGEPSPMPSTDRLPDASIQEIRLDLTFSALWAARRRVATITSVCVAAAVIFLIGARSEYASEAVLLPEKESDAAISLPGMDLLQQFGGLLGGIDASSFSGKPIAIPVQLYPKILASTPLLLDLLETPVQPVGHTASMPLATYLRDHKPFSLWESLAEIPSAVSGLLRRDAPQPLAGSDSTVVQLGPDAWALVEDLGERLSARVDLKEGVLHVSASMPDPVVAAMVASAAVGRLTDFATDYRVQKLREDLSFVESRYVEAEGRFNHALDRLAEFQDRNRNLARNQALAEEQRLQADYDLAFSVYTSLANRLEESRITVQEKTPVFKILQPAAVPIRRSSPQRLLALFLGLAAGLGVSALLVLRNGSAPNPTRSP